MFSHFTDTFTFFSFLFMKTHCDPRIRGCVLRAYIRQRKHPSWTSYFVRYRDIQDDNFGDKHFNFDVDGHNYHILRTGAYPYIKYHCTKRPNEDLTKENNFYRLITIINLGLPCFLYGLAAVALIRHKERVDFVRENGQKATVHIHFLIEEQHDRC
ncbi:unnamed protein product, partial [Mesorhabditis belari]|uniref:Uncharacterized protein n=1 Tax=Mesorhabditis belari TaxID=2138241 RepID=A0AAF3F216_9BILA